MKHSLAILAALIASLSVTSMAASLELANDPATGEPGKFAAEEIGREAKTRGIALGEDAQETRISLSVEKDAKAVSQSYQALLSQGWTDAIRKLHPEAALYTFWDYFRDSYARNPGIRIDQVLLNQRAAVNHATANVGATLGR